MLSYSDICGLVAESYDVPATWQAGDDIRAVGTQVGDEFVVAIPGTTDLAGWLKDFSIWPKPFPIIGTYHEGFGKWGLKLGDLALKDVPSTGRIVFAGHSLGAQLAQVLAAVYASVKGKTPPMRVVTVGCPRGAFMGNVTAGGLVRSGLEAVSFRNFGDPVCEVPPWLIWKHNVGLTTLGDRLVESVPTMADHSIALYLSRLKNLESKPA